MLLCSKNLLTLLCFAIFYQCIKCYDTLISIKNKVLLFKTLLLFCMVFISLALKPIRINE